MFLDQLNARLAVKKQSAELSKLSPLEAIAKSIQKDSAAYSATHIYKSTCSTCKGSGTIKMGNLDCPACKGKKEVAKAEVGDYQVVQKDWAAWNAKNGKTGGAAVLGQAPKSASGKAVDIGGGFAVHRHGMDTNGNHSVWVSQGGSKAKKIQTNGNTPTVHREARSDGTITQAGADEIKSHFTKYIAK